MISVPQNIAIVELKKELTKAINYALIDLKIPAYAIEYVMKELLGEVTMQTEREYNQSVQEYQAQLQKEQTSTIPSEDSTKEQV